MINPLQHSQCFSLFSSHEKQIRSKLLKNVFHVIIVISNKIIIKIIKLTVWHLDLDCHVQHYIVESVQHDICMPGGEGETWSNPNAWLATTSQVNPSLAECGQNLVSKFHIFHIYCTNSSTPSCFRQHLREPVLNFFQTCHESFSRFCYKIQQRLLFYGFNNLERKMIL